LSCRRAARPAVPLSRYVNLPFHERYGLQRYEDLLVNDIPAEIARTFQARRGLWTIGGLSMGGPGAFRKSILSIPISRPGAHPWEYWDEHSQEAIVQHARVLGFALLD